MLSAAFSLGVIALLFYSNSSAMDILRQEVCTTAQELLAVSQKRLDDNFSGVSAHLSSYTATPREIIETLERSAPDTTAYYVCMERIRRLFTSALPGYPVDSFFYYDDSRGLYFANTVELNSPIRQAIVDMDPLITRENAGKWFVLSAGGEDYLVRVVRISRSYIGAWLKVSSALSQVQGDQLTGSEVYLMDGQGAFLSSSAPDVIISPKAIAEGGGYAFVAIDGEQYLAATQRANFGDFYLTALIADITLTSGFRQLTLVIIVGGLAALLILSLGGAFLQRWIVRPIAQLTAAIRALKSGDFEASLPVQTYEEFEEVNQAFNQATEEIKTLKIDMYEERLHKQKIQMQYLQSQIAPHFLINCLNTVYQLADAEQPELLRAMLRVLSEHLRYTLSSSETVPLDEELRHVENYIELSAIRYPNSVFLYKDYDEAAVGAAVIPLLILNFVENTIKYEAGMDRRLEVHIAVRRVAQDGASRVHIQIWDSGGGFGEPILSNLQDIPAYLEKHSDGHIGIANVFQRADILFADCAFRFSNREGAGAQIDIDIPYVPYWKEGADEPADR